MRKKTLSDLKKIKLPEFNFFGKNATKTGSETNRNGKTGSRQRTYTINLCPISKKEVRSQKEEMSDLRNAGESGEKGLA